MRLRLLFVFKLLLATPFFAGVAAASELILSIEIPQLNVAEYHRPYAAIWVESEGRGVVANLAVWYDMEKKEGKGTEWLKDMRQWWRRSGRSLEMPIDGVSGATRAPGVHTLTFNQGQAPLGELPPGDYHVIVEAAREVGGRELLKIPFQWPPKQEQTLPIQGKSELGKLTVKLRP